MLWLIFCDCIASSRIGIASMPGNCGPSGPTNSIAPAADQHRASGSVTLLGDSLHNVADGPTAVPLLIAFALGRRPAWKRYTYGYWRADDLAGLFVVVMISLSAVFAAYEAIRRLLNPHSVTHLWAVAAAAVVGFLGNELVARYRIRVGRRIGSAVSPRTAATQAA